MQMGVIALQSILSFQAALSRVDTHKGSQGNPPVRFFRAHWSCTGGAEWRANYERPLCRVHMRWDQDEIRGWPMLSEVIYILSVLIGFHRLTPSPFHPSWLPATLLISSPNPLHYLRFLSTALLAQNSWSLRVCLWKCDLRRESFHKQAARWLDWMSFMCK